MELCVASAIKLASDPSLVAAWEEYIETERPHGCVGSFDNEVWFQDEEESGNSDAIRDD